MSCPMIQRHYRFLFRRSDDTERNAFRSVFFPKRENLPLSPALIQNGKAIDKRSTWCANSNNARHSTDDGGWCCASRSGEIHERRRSRSEKALQNGTARSLLLTYHSQLFAHWTPGSQHSRTECPSSQVAAYRATASYSHGPPSIVIASPRRSDLRLSCHAELHHTCSRASISLLL